MDFFERNKLTGSARYYAEALLRLGTSEKKVLEAIKPLLKEKEVVAKVIITACPNCNSQMQRVKLIDRDAMYCTKDRVCVPVPRM